MSVTQEQIHEIAKAYTAAWNSKSPEAVASFYAEAGRIVINEGPPWVDRAGVADMAAGFYADVPDLTLVCDDIRLSGQHAVYVWTFTGHDAASGAPLAIRGWEEWDLTSDGLVQSSRGWFDADDYARQAAGA
ncbi:MAG: nuclear transport factor 2 family protein [Pseudomonadota bacterium]